MKGKHLRFHIGVGEAVGVHGGQVCTADDANHQARLLGAVLERDHDAAPLLQGLIVSLVNLEGGTEEFIGQKA